MLPLRAILPLALALFLDGAAAFAQDAPKTQPPAEPNPDAASAVRHAYEQDLIERALDYLDLKADPAPQGKTIEQVAIVRFPIVEANDPWPNFLNLFHVTTREQIVRQELLFQEGEIYDAERAQESARNLRSWPLIFSTVRIVTAQGSQADRTIVVVICKDLWSIRLNSNFSVGGGVFNYLQLMPSEQNFLGFNQQVSLYTFVDPAVMAVGQVYRVPRLLGSRLSLYENLVMRTNYKTGKQEGGFGQISVGQPLFSVDSKWGFSVALAFDLGTDRDFQGAELRTVEILDEDGSRKDVHKIWEHRMFLGSVSAVRSFGHHWKTNLQLGYEIKSYVYQLRSDFPAESNLVRQTFIDKYLPLNDQGGWLVFSTNFYEAEYLRLQNIETFGLSEDFRVGPSATVEAAWANPAFGFAAQAVRLNLALGWVLSLGQDLLSIYGGLSTRYLPQQDQVKNGTSWVDRVAEIEIKNVSPSIFDIGRLVFHFHYIYSQHAQNRGEYTLGGDNTLRGFVSGYLSGPRVFNVNLEFRSSPWVIRTLHWGFTLFYDGGDAYGYTEKTDFVYHQSIGFGIRGLFPQFDRGVMRLDFGLPLGDDFARSKWLNWVTFTYRQAF